MNKCALIPRMLAFGFYVFCSTNIAAADPRVRGRVVRPDGNPVAHASVEVHPIARPRKRGVAGDSPGNPWIAADDSGHFDLVLAPGRYRIEAKDELDCFPDPTFWLNHDPKAKFPVVSVGNNDVSGVEVVLGRRGGILLGLVRDADTHKPIPNAMLRLQDARNSYAFAEISTNPAGRFQYTIASKPILISVMAQGYKMATVQNGAKVILSPGEHREIEIDLQHE